MYNNVEYYP